MPIDFKFTGDANQLVREYEKLEQKVVRMEERQQKLARESKTAHDAGIAGARSHASAAGALTSQLTGLVASYGSVAGIIGLVNRTLEQNKQLWAEAGEVAIKTAAAQQEALKNLAGMTTGEKQDLLGPVAERIQLSAKFPDRAAIIKAMGAGYSASGDIALTQSAVEAAASLSRLTPDSIETISAGALDVARGSGISDAKRNLSFLLSAGAINRIVDPTALAEGLAPLVASGVATVPGQDRQAASLDIGALFGVMAKASTDVTGKSTGTAVTQLLGQMESFFATRDDPGSVLGRIEALQGNEQLRKQFLSGASFKEKYKIPVREMLTGGTSLDRELEAARGSVSFDASLFQQLEREISTATPELRVATMDAANKAGDQTSDLSSSRMELGLARKGLSSSLKRNVSPYNVAGGWLETWLGERAFDIVAPFVGGETAMNAILQGQQVTTATGANNQLLGPWGGQVSEITSLLRALVEEVRGSGRGFSAEAVTQND